MERSVRLRPALAQLTDDERRIIELRFVEDLSQLQIGRVLGFSQIHVSRLLVDILSRLRDGLDLMDAPATA